VSALIFLLAGWQEQREFGASSLKRAVPLRAGPTLRASPQLAAWSCPKVWPPSACGGLAGGRQDCNWPSERQQSANHRHYLTANGPARDLKLDYDYLRASVMMMIGELDNKLNWRRRSDMNSPLWAGARARLAARRQQGGGQLPGAECAGGSLRFCATAATQTSGRAGR